MKSKDDSSRLPQILITNDDGVHSPGILAAADAVAPFAEVRIVAPLNQQTAMGRAFRGNPQAALEEVKLTSNGRVYQAYGCEASPARAVEHGLKVMHGYKPDLVISGINYGENLGSSITGSGTVGAAIEAAVKGIPSIAVSLETPVDCHFDYTQQNWDVAAHFLRYFVSQALERGFPDGVDILKIDVPTSATKECPWQVTKLSRSSYYQTSIAAPSLKSRLCDSIVCKNECTTEEPGTDIYALAVDQVVSVTPLSLDLTAYDSFASLDTWR